MNRVAAFIIRMHGRGFAKFAAALVVGRVSLVRTSDLMREPNPSKRSGTDTGAVYSITLTDTLIHITRLSKDNLPRSVNTIGGHGNQRWGVNAPLGVVLLNKSWDFF